jgi:5-methylcytosine-specific restriction protein A
MRRYCATPGCPVIIDRGRGHCALHTAPASRGWANDDARIRGRALQVKRKRLFELEPLCRHCMELADRVEPAVIRDHIIPLAEGGTEDDTNIQPLCQACSDRKTAEESKRGMKRAR